MLYDNKKEEVRKNRQPAAVYCKYDVAHTFTTV